MTLLTTMSRQDNAVRVEELMRQIEDEVRQARRARLLAPGGSSAYEDAEVFAIVERTIRRAVEERDPDVLLLPDLIGDEKDWRLDTRLQFTSHRPVLGPLIVFFKRRVLFPLTRWLFEYTMENFRRQDKVNVLLFACVEELAIKNAELQRIAGLTDVRIAEGTMAEGTENTR